MMKKKTKITIAGCMVAILIGIFLLMFPLNYYRLHYSITSPKHLSDKSFCNSDNECGYSKSCFCPSGSCENFVYNRLSEFRQCPKDIYVSCRYLIPPRLLQCKCVNHTCKQIPVNTQKALEILKRKCGFLCKGYPPRYFNTIEEVKKVMCGQYYDTTLWGGILTDHCYKENNDFISINCTVQLKNDTYVSITKELCEMQYS